MRSHFVRLACSQGRKSHTRIIDLLSGDPMLLPLALLSRSSAFLRVFLRIPFSRGLIWDEKSSLARPTACLAELHDDWFPHSRHIKIAIVPTARSTATSRDWYFLGNVLNLRLLYVFSVLFYSNILCRVQEEYQYVIYHGVLGDKGRAQRVVLSDQIWGMQSNMLW